MISKMKVIEIGSRQIMKIGDEVSHKMQLATNPNEICFTFHGASKNEQDKLWLLAMGKNSQKLTR
jgi:hypothetical protein